ncbi:hypothetical protein QJS66_07090 [Kocuria rhizophila]|nr:hypothetical protein QJS66_07090 [Kocuria rhizophila]
MEDLATSYRGAGRAVESLLPGGRAWEPGGGREHRRRSTPSRTPPACGAVVLSPHGGRRRTARPIAGVRVGFTARCDPGQPARRRAAAERGRGRAAGYVPVRPGRPRRSWAALETLLALLVSGSGGAGGRAVSVGPLVSVVDNLLAAGVRVTAEAKRWCRRTARALPHRGGRALALPRAVCRIVLALGPPTSVRCHRGAACRAAGLPPGQHLTPHCFPR